MRQSNRERLFGVCEGIAVMAVVFAMAGLWRSRQAAPPPLPRPVSEPRLGGPGAELSRTFEPGSAEQGQPGAQRSLRSAALERPAGNSSVIQRNRLARLDEPAPEVELADYSGGAYRLSTFRGRRVVLNFFCGCAECRELAPEWQRLHRTVPGAVVLGLSAFSPTRAEEFRAETGVSFPLLFDSGSDIAARYDALHCPRSFVVDGDGRLRYASGSGDSPADIIQALRRHLGEEPTRAARASGE